MAGRHFTIPAMVAVIVWVAGCGSPSALTHPGPITRKHGQWTFTVKWKGSPVQLKPLKATLKISPAQPNLSPSLGLMTMSDMHMVPVIMHWHKEKPGLYQGIAIPTMAGPWDVTVTFHHGRQKWQESFPVEVQN